nr:hypothetical protein [Ectobacillus panaciterrae]
MVRKRGVYRSVKDCIQVIRLYKPFGLYVVGEKILFGREKVYCSRMLAAMITIGFQLIVWGRAKIVLSAAGFREQSSSYKANGHI